LIPLSCLDTAFHHALSFIRTLSSVVQSRPLRLEFPRQPIVTVIKRKPGSSEKTVGAPIGILVAYCFPVLLLVDCVCYIKLLCQIRHCGLDSPLLFGHCITLRIEFHLNFLVFWKAGLSRLDLSIRPSVTALNRKTVPLNKNWLQLEQQFLIIILCLIRHCGLDSPLPFRHYFA
jgi:hypothetical protein